MLEIALRHFRKALRKNPNDPVTLQHIASVLHRKAQLLRRCGEERREEIVSVKASASEVESLIVDCVRGGRWHGAAGEILAHVFDTKRMYNNNISGNRSKSDERKGQSMMMEKNRSFRVVRSKESEETRRRSLERKAASFSKIVGALRQIKIQQDDSDDFTE